MSIQNRTRAAKSAQTDDDCVVVVPGSAGGGSGASCSCLVMGDARLSVLTPYIVRMEHHGGCTSGCFEDAPSTTFTNRAPPESGRVCTWAASSTHLLELNTSSLALRYTGGAFTADSLSIAGRDGVWRPGSSENGNLNGTFTSKDCGGECDFPRFSPLFPLFSCNSPPFYSICSQFSLESSGMNPLTAEVCIQKYLPRGTLVHNLEP